jgi:hypothetical protein
VGLVLGALLAAVLFVMEVTEEKQRNPCEFIGVKRGDWNKYWGLHSSSEPNGQSCRTKKSMAFAFWGLKHVPDEL